MKSILTTTTLICDSKTRQRHIKEIESHLSKLKLIHELSALLEACTDFNNQEKDPKLKVHSMRLIIDGSGHRNYLAEDRNGHLLMDACEALHDCADMAVLDHWKIIVGDGLLENLKKNGCPGLATQYEAEILKNVLPTSKRSPVLNPRL